MKKAIHTLKLIKAGIIAYAPRYLLIENIGPHYIDRLEPIQGFEFRAITPDNLHLIREWKGPSFIKKFRSLLQRGELGIFGLLDGRVVGYVWGSVKMDDWSPANWHNLIETGDAIVGRLEVHPDYRRKGLGMYIRAYQAKFLDQVFGSRLKNTYGTILLENKPMQAMVSQMDFHFLKEMHTYILFGHIFLIWTYDLDPGTRQRNGRRRFHIRFKVPNFLFSPAFSWLGLRPRRAEARL